MTILYSILFFVYGTIFGSFYNVVGDRVPVKQSIIKPGSHCPKCKHRLTPLELIPILSYVFQKGKCKKCHTSIPVFHPIFEMMSGLTFVICYLCFGLTIDLIIPITLISLFLILIVSDLEYFIIPGEVLIVFFAILSIEILVINGVQAYIMCILNALISGGIMAALKLFGDFLFKKESMGGGDIKLLFFFGLALGWQGAALSIFLGSLVGFPISLLVLGIKKTNVIPFGPCLVLGASIVLFTGLDFMQLVTMLAV